jgi:hypothetical protein
MLCSEEICRLRSTKNTAGGLLSRVEAQISRIKRCIDETLLTQKIEVASFGQDLRVFKWNRCGNQAADFIAGSVAKYASSGVWSERLE